MKAPAISLMLGIAAMAGAQTREPPGAIGQIGAPGPAAGDTRSNQIATPSRNVVTPIPMRMPPGANAMPQIAPVQDRQAPAQLAHEPPNAAAPAQLSHGPPSARPPAPLSRPSDGRTAAVARVTGQDRCDSAGSPVSAAATACRAVIETRGADFPPPAPTPLSPEQRLLVEQRTPAPPGPQGEAIARTAARGAAAGADADAPAVQGVASVYLGTAAPAQPVKSADPVSGLTADQAAAATAVLGALEAPRR